MNSTAETRIAQKTPSILLLVRSFEAGGAERQVVQLATGLHQRGHEVRVGVLYRRGAFVGDLERAGVEVIDLRKTGRWDVFGFFARAVKALRQAKPDVLYSFLGGSNVVAGFLRPFGGRMKLVWSVRGTYRDLSKDDWIHRATYRVERLMCGLPDLIISNSRAGRRFGIERGFSADLIEVVPNGIDTDRFRPDPARRAELRGRWNIGESDIAVGVLSRFHPMKGFPIFLRAAALVAAKRKEIRFFCVGQGVDDGQLQALADELGVGRLVTFVGLAGDSVSVLNALDIYCSPSIAGEGFSNSVAEAMACGVPCVVTDVGDSAFIVGDMGNVVAPSDPEALAAAILDMADRLDRFDRRQIRGRIVENFSADAMIDRTLELLGRLDDEG